MKQSWIWACGLALLVGLAAFGFIAPGEFAAAPEGKIVAADLGWVLSASGLVLLMTPGLAFFYGGMVSSRSIISTLMQSYVSMGVVSLVWVTVGFSLAFGPSHHGLIGDPAAHAFMRGVGAAPHAELGKTIPFLLFAIFQMKFAIITPALITGAFAERVRFASYLVFITLWSLLVYAPLAHWAWHPEGILYKLGCLDFAGGTVVHISAGMAALAGAMCAGRRITKESGEAAPPANIPYVMLGTGLLWFGWFGFNAGSSLAANEIAVLAFVNTNTASAVAMLAWIFIEGLRGNKPSALGACVAAVVGLVCITPSAGFVGIEASVAIGLIGALLSNCAVHFMHKVKLDDTLDVFACHGLGGIFGMLALGVFARSGGLITGGTELFFAQLTGLIITVAFTFVGSFLLFKVVNTIIPFRVSAAEEKRGLDISQHGETAFTEKPRKKRRTELSEDLDADRFSGPKVDRAPEEDQAITFDPTPPPSVSF